MRRKTRLAAAAACAFALAAGPVGGAAAADNPPTSGVLGAQAQKTQARASITIDNVAKTLNGSVADLLTTRNTKKLPGLAKMASLQLTREANKLALMRLPAQAEQPQVQLVASLRALAADADILRSRVQKNGAAGVPVGIMHLSSIGSARHALGLLRASLAQSQAQQRSAATASSRLAPVEDTVHATIVNLFRKPTGDPKQQNAAAAAALRNEAQQVRAVSVPRSAGGQRNDLASALDGLANDVQARAATTGIAWLNSLLVVDRARANLDEALASTGTATPATGVTQAAQQQLSKIQATVGSTLQKLFSATSAKDVDSIAADAETQLLDEAQAVQRLTVPASARAAQQTLATALKSMASDVGAIRANVGAGSVSSTIDAATHLSTLTTLSAALSRFDAVLTGGQTARAQRSAAASHVATVRSTLSDSVSHLLDVRNKHDVARLANDTSIKLRREANAIERLSVPANAQAPRHRLVMALRDVANRVDRFNGAVQTGKTTSILRAAANLRSGLAVTQKLNAFAKSLRGAG